MIIEIVHVDHGMRMHWFDGFNLEHALSEAVKTVSRTEHIQFFFCLYSISAHQCIHPPVTTASKFDFLLGSGAFEQLPNSHARFGADAN